MNKTQSTQGYRLKLTGAGISLDRDVSEEVAREVLNLAMGAPVQAIPAGVMRAEDHSRASAPDSNTTPKAFMAAKRPENDIERVTCLAYYLAHYRHLAAFKTIDLTKLNTEAAQPKLSNPSFAARNATSANYLSLAGKGNKQITNRGEAVVEALPDRAKVKLALESQPSRRRKKGKARKPKKA